MVVWGKNGYSLLPLPISSGSWDLGLKPTLQPFSRTQPLALALCQVHRDKAGSLGLPCRYAGRSDAGCLYELYVKLLSENEDVLAEYKTETIAIPQDNDANWTEVSDSCSFSR